MFKRIKALLTPKVIEPCPPHVFPKWKNTGYGSQIQYCKKCNLAQTRSIVNVNPR